MPELPEVESVVRSLQVSGILGKSIEKLEIFWPRLLGTISPSLFQDQLLGKKILSANRHGKYILLGLSDQKTLFVHLRMSGRFIFKDDQTNAEKHEHIIFTFEDGKQLVYHDTRKFGRFTLTDDPDLILSTIGFDPFDSRYTIEWFSSALSTQNKALKSLLLNQLFLAGLGNIYVDECLWQSLLHPERLASSLKSQETIRLYHAIRSVLEQGIERGGTSLGSGTSNFHHVNGQSGHNQHFLKVYGRTGKACFRCTMPIVKIQFAQRGTHFCPHCQLK